MGSTSSKCKNLKGKSLAGLQTGLNSSEFFTRPAFRTKLVKICQLNDKSLSTIYEAPIDLEEANIP